MRRNSRTVSGSHHHPSNPYPLFHCLCFSCHPSSQGSAFSGETRRLMMMFENFLLNSLNVRGKQHDHHFAITCALASEQMKLNGVISLWEIQRISQANLNAKRPFCLFFCANFQAVYETENRLKHILHLL